MKKTFLNAAIIFFASIGIFFIITSTILYFSDKQARYECQKLESQSVEFKDADFFISSSEKAMCDSVGMYINAPVK